MSKPSPPPSDCQLFEILQYGCTSLLVRPPGWTAKVNYTCVPIPRIFRQCGSGPAVEVTKVLEYNDQTGAVEIPSDLKDQLPKGKPWKDVKIIKTPTL